MPEQLANSMSIHILEELGARGGGAGPLWMASPVPQDDKAIDKALENRLKIIACYDLFLRSKM